MGKKQIELNRKQLEETLTYLGYKIYDGEGNLTDKGFNVISRLLEQHVVESVMLPTFIAQAWAKDGEGVKKVKFFNIVWDTDGEDVPLPCEVVMDLPVDFDVAMEGADKLSDAYGWCLSAFEFEVVG